MLKVFDALEQGTFATGVIYRPRPDRRQIEWADDIVYFLYDTGLIHIGCDDDMDMFHMPYTENGSPDW